MADPFVAEIRIYPFNFAPKGWAMCDGQLLPVSQNTALFSLIGSFYGGNGQTTFALPNLQGSAPMHQGQGSGLTNRFLGENGGSDSVTLLESEMPAHQHAIRGHDLDLAELNAPATNRVLAQSTNGTIYSPAANLVTMAAQALSPAGGGLPHNNLQPYLTLLFCIAMQGVFPPRP